MHVAFNNLCHKWAFVVWILVWQRRGRGWQPVSRLAGVLVGQEQKKGKKKTLLICWIFFPSSMQSLVSTEKLFLHIKYAYFSLFILFWDFP